MNAQQDPKRKAKLEQTLTKLIQQAEADMAKAEEAHQRYEDLCAEAGAELEPFDDWIVVLNVRDGKIVERRIAFVPTE